MIGILLAVGIIIAVLAVIVIGYIISVYNGLVRLKNNIEKAWSNIDVLLKQRHDELTKLIESVKGYMKFEKSLLTEITEARTAFLKAKTVPQKAKADNVMSDTLKTLFAVAENYPKLRANENFIQFQGRVSEIENNIADRREFYNDSVNTFNTRIEQIPYNIFAGMLHYVRKELFKVEAAEREDVEVKF